MSTDIANIHAALGIPTDYATRRGLTPVAEAQELVDVGHDMFGRQQVLAPGTAAAWSHMRLAAEADGIVLQLVSGFRSIDYQRQLIERKLARGLTVEAILAANAAPGFSEHHSGRALDIATPGSPPLETEFEQTDAFAWLLANGTGFGFHLSYPRDNPYGLLYEPWHWATHV